MVRNILIGLAALVFVVQVASSLSTSGATSTNQRLQPPITHTNSASAVPAHPVGDAAVFAEIDASTSCTALQRTFDRFMDAVDARPGGDPARDVPFSYARAAQTRMTEIGCFR